MSPHKVGDRLVPRSPVGADTTHIPPLAVEITVSKLHHLSQSVQERLEKGKKAAEPAEQRDGGELHHAFCNGHKVQLVHHVERVLEKRCGVLGRGDPDYDAETCDFDEAPEDETPADML
jgi:hypothetical protein